METRSQNTKAVYDVIQNVFFAMNNNLTYLLKINSADTVEHENMKTDQHEKFPNFKYEKCLKTGTKAGSKQTREKMTKERTSTWQNSYYLLLNLWIK